MKHIELQHSNDLYHRIKGYDTPEEIEKWKAERRENFPTPENILRKKAERQEMRARGEKMGCKNGDEEEVFRYKIVPEKRSRNTNYRPGVEYQSDGEDDFKLKKKTKRGEIAETNRSVFSTYNTSAIVKLLNFYTDIEVTEQGKLIGSTRETWIPQVDEEANLKNFSADEAQERAEFNITDDEDDECFSALGAKSDKIPISTPFGDNTSVNSNGIVLNSTLTTDAADSTNELKTDQKSSGGLMGLLSYDSASDGEVDGKVTTYF